LWECQAGIYDEQEAKEILKDSTCWQKVGDVHEETIIRIR
jgi:hypothetical protein